MKIGIFGGSFDPVHQGHLIIAEHVLETFELDRVIFVPAAQSPHKPNPPIAPPKQRVEMLKLAIAGHSAFEVSTVEIDRGEISYTVDTLQALNAQYPDTDWYLVLGADAVQHFDRWREPEKILQQCQLIVCHRGGFGKPDLSALKNVASAEQLSSVANNVADCPLIEISSSEIRSRIANHRSIRYLTPRAVEKYILTNNVYATSNVSASV